MTAATITIKNYSSNYYVIRVSAYDDAGDSVYHAQLKQDIDGVDREDLSYYEEGRDILSDLETIEEIEERIASNAEYGIMYNCVSHDYR